MATALQALQALATQPGMPPEIANVLAHIQSAADAISAAAVATAAPQPPPTQQHGQQAPPQQQQQQQPSDAHQACAPAGHNAGGGKGAKWCGGGGGGFLASGMPASLAPKGRWTRGAAAASGDSGGEAPPGGVAAEALAATGASAPSKNGGNDEEDDRELIDEGSTDMEIDMQVAESISKLPEADQARLKAALGARGGRRRLPEDGSGEGRAAGGRDRERSPRPLKGGGGHDDL